MTRGIVAQTVINHAKKAAERLSRTDHGAEREWGWFVAELSKMSLANNYQFFRRIAGRRDPETFLRWCLCTLTLSGSSDLQWVFHEAEKVYGAGVPPFQPKLLEIVRKFGDSSK